MSASENVSEYSLIINKPIDFVFANTTCLKGCINWVTGMVETEKVSPEPVQVGSKYRHVHKFMGMKGEADVTVLVNNPPYEFKFRADSALPVVNHYIFEEVAEGTRVTHYMEFQPTENLIGKLTAPILIRRFQSQLENDLNNLKEMLEQGIVVKSS